MMRGYRHLAATPDGLELVTTLKDAMSRVSLVEPADGASRLVFGAAHASAEQAVQQFLMVHLGGTRFNEAVLFAVGSREPLVFPLPCAWRAAIEAYGLRVDHRRSAGLWAGFMLVAWLLSVRRLVAVIWRAWRTRSEARGGPHAAFFDALSASCLPAPGTDGRSFDILTWYARWAGRSVDVRRLTHTVSGANSQSVDGIAVSTVAGPLPAPDTVGAWVRYLGWSLAAFIVSAGALVRGRWWNALMLGQGAEAALVRCAPHGSAREYLFHNSGWLYRPLWTYEAERAGARILLYFYSANVETFKRPWGAALQANTWNLATWPHYLVWDQSQEAFVRRHVPGTPVVDVVGPIWFQSSPAAMPQLSAGAIAVFDVQPVRASARVLLTAQRVYYQPDVSRRFFDDVRAVLAAQQRPLVFKRKRRTDERFLHGSYRRLMVEVAQDSVVVEVEPAIAGWRVVESSAAVISMPFTSTALVAVAQGKPAVYYSPEAGSGTWLQADDPAAHGVPIVCGRDALRAWVAALPEAREERR